MSFDLESGRSINPQHENDITRLVSKLSRNQYEPIFNNTELNEVILLDISCDKKWISYVTYRRQEDDSQSYEMDGDQKRMFITRRQFTAINSETKNEEMANNIEEIQSNDSEHFSLEITDDVNNGGRSHCKFLSISEDGKFVVLSFFERNPASYSGYKESNNPNCLIYEVSNGEIQLKHRLKCNGRAVFLSERECSLALIDNTTVKVYNNFPKNKAVSFLFDLRPFISSERYLHEGVEDDESFIQNASWVDIRNDETNQDMRRVITFSRHIRHNILTTPFRGGIVRVWSIVEDGVRLTSFSAKNQHVMAFSKNYKYTAAYVEGKRSVNIYNVKSGLLVYQLKSQVEESDTPFEVSHIRFCYGGRYLAMSGVEGDNVVFEVWYIEAEESIYRTTEPLLTRPKDSYYSSDKRLIKVAQPFVMKGVKEIKGIKNTNHKCIRGVYTSFNKGKLATTFVELDIDKVSNDHRIIWVKDLLPVFKNTFEIENNLNEYTNLKCGHFYIDSRRYMIRFGKHTVQLWRLCESENHDSNRISHNDELLYIRAYKGPDYGLEYSFRETWRIFDFDSIQLIGGTPSGRMLVNITETTDENDYNTNDLAKYYHTEEIFLPLDELLLTSKGTSGLKTLKYDYHKLESACQALHYLSTIENGNSGTNIIDPIKYKANFDIINTKTINLITLAVENIDKESNFFSTIAGSRTLAMLASFKMGREIIKKIVVKSIPISIFSYPKIISKAADPDEDEDERYERLLSLKKEKEKWQKLEAKENELQENSLAKKTKSPYRDSEKKRFTPIDDSQSIASNENVLTVLIDELSYDMYKLLFNRILSDSKKMGPGCLSSLTDALLLLQEEGNTDLLLSSSQKLSYLEIEKSKLGVLESEISHVMKVKTLQKEYISSIRNLETYAIMEQIKKYDRTELIFYKIKYLYNGLEFKNEKFSKVKKKVRRFWRLNVRNSWRRLFKESRKEPKKLSKVCVVPLPHFNSYSNFPEDRPKYTKHYIDDAQTYKDNSAFVRVALDQHSNNIFRQGDTVLEVMLEYKWKEFARWRFIGICIIHIIYYISYATGVLFSEELYDHQDEDEYLIKDPGQIISIALMCISVSVLILQEARQFWKTHSRLDYFFSGYNWIDIAAFIFPIFTLLQLKFGWDNFYEVCSISTLILWTHGILRLRVISYFGITLETIIQLSRNIAAVLFIMLLIIFAFTNAYIILLRQQLDGYFQNNYEGVYNSTDGVMSGETHLVDVSADNGFSNWFKAFYQVWFFVYGVWDPINDGDAGDDKLIMCISIVFSLITVLIFFNLVIALMASTVEEVKKRGKKVWVSHFAAVVSEIELLWCLDSAKHSRKNNPTYIYYIANYDSVTRHEEKLYDETLMLLKKLNINQ